jgi:hypothetical protein|tara:strand:+ start:685 stop:936 length:252 start_codon:yes stop_codon:yes gene_type:complete
MKTTNNKQLTEIEQQIANIFSRYKRQDNRFRIAIEEDGKVNKIAQIKDYLNTNCIDYDLAVKFAGGKFWQEYTTILSIEVVEV